MFENLSDDKFIVGGEDDFQKFNAQFQRWDHHTLKTYWKKACIRKALLIIRRVAPMSAQIHIIPIKDAKHIKNLLHLRQGEGWLGIKLPLGKTYVFHKDFLKEAEQQEFEVQQPPPPMKRKPGRPRKVQYGTPGEIS